MVAPSAQSAPSAKDGGKTVERGPSYRLIARQAARLLTGDALSSLKRLGEDGSGARLGLLTAIQYCEGLPNRQALWSLRQRTDWQAVLQIEPGCPFPSAEQLEAFQTRLEASEAGRREFSLLLDALHRRGLRQCAEETVAATGRQVLDAVANLNRIDRIATALSAAIQSLASWNPGWLLSISEPHWYHRYDLSGCPASWPTDAAQQQQVLAQLGSDVRHLLMAAAAAEPAAGARDELRELESIARIDLGMQAQDWTAQ